MKLYVDESGSITTVNNERNRYFVITYIETDEPSKVASVFRRVKKNYIKHNPQHNFDVKKEIKGSEMPNDFKTIIFQELSEKCNIKAHYIIFDNWNAVDRLRNKPSVAFNYLTFLKTRSAMRGLRSGFDLHLKLDNRNCAVYGLHSLQEYLEIEFCLKTSKCSNVYVKYHDSDKKELIQIADIFSNTLYKTCKYHGKEHPKLIKHYENNKAICNILPKGHQEFFPAKLCEFDFIN
ncbi:DUF3800 domain-containing protein [Vagococcus fluvialis]|uniref:DUF3800 domain-containing protein n=1 Tax=Vagococcus fluvialis TaxID=2738 RepID=UPI00288E0521|nr:DUF3800 domain-containing protein [Vagococcus fluvialis]MDT2782747.1 DUF3800 domain-containing protein [Vagococcus fluvialis]